MNEFISPNWHVLFIHYPIAFLSAGIVIELLSFLWPRGLLRAAGRWIILLGALLAIPTLAVGMYAFATVVGSGRSWYEVVERSRWSPEQWHAMSRHIWLNSIGVLLVVVAVTTWVASSDNWRRRLYWPVLLLLIAGMGSFSAGAWFGGESVYRFGTAVALPASRTAAAEPAHHGIKWFIPPLELHVALAGMTVAIAIGALGLTIRRLEPPEVVTEPGETMVPGEQTPEEPHGRSEVTVPVPPSMPYAPRPVFAARIWLAAAVVGLGAAIAGLWSAINVFSADTLKQNVTMVRQPGHIRLLLHLIFGVTVVVLTLALAALARFSRRRRKVTAAFLVLSVLVIALQFWLGLAMLYDGRTGPVLGFKSPPAGR